MNIKAKLMEQLEVLENLQLLATNSGALNTALDTSGTILDYIRCIDMTDEDDNDEDDCGCYDTGDTGYTCPVCRESVLKQSLHQDIANACDMPIEVVNRVMDVMKCLTT